MQIAYCQLDYETTPGETDNDELLREEIKKAMIALESAYCGFDNATHNPPEEEPELPAPSHKLLIPETPIAYT